MLNTKALPDTIIRHIAEQLNKRNKEIFFLLNRRLFCLLLTLFSVISYGQFKYIGWNVGYQTGKYDIKNGLSSYSLVSFNDPNEGYMTDSSDCKFNVNNIRFNIEIVKPDVFVKCGVSLPIKKNFDHNNPDIYGKHFELDIKFGYGFDIKERVGFQFGLNGGVFSLIHESMAGTYHYAGPNRFDYFVPSEWSDPESGNKFFGSMGAWLGGVNITNVIAFNDQIGLKSSYNYAVLKNNRKTIDGKMNQIEVGLYYSNRDLHNLGFHINFVHNSIQFKGAGPVASESINESARLYPATAVKMSTIYIGINVPLNFSE